MLDPIHLDEDFVQMPLSLRTVLASFSTGQRMRSRAPVLFHTSPGYLASPSSLRCSDSSRQSESTAIHVDPHMLTVAARIAKVKEENVQELISTSSKKTGWRTILSSAVRLRSALRGVFHWNLSAVIMPPFTICIALTIN
jgi:hypothetical protein